MQVNRRISCLHSGWLLLTVLFLPTVLLANPTDSLLVVWNDATKADSIRMKAYKKYIWDNYLFSNPDSALILAEAMSYFGKQNNYPIATNQAYTLKGIAHEMKGEFPKAQNYLERAIAGNESIGNQPGISEALIAIGVIYEELGNYPKAVECYNKALLIDEEIDNKEGIAMSLNNLGNIYNDQGNIEKALEYYQRALAIDEELGVKQGIAVELGNIGSIYQSQGKFEESLAYFKKGLDINYEIGDFYGVGSTYVSLGSLHEDKGQLDSALVYYKKSEGIFDELGMEQESARNWNSIGRLYIDMGKLNLAQEYCEKSRKLSEELSAINTQSSSCYCLYKVNKLLGNSGKALGFFEEMITLRDQIYNESNTKKLTQLQMQYEFDKKEAATKAEQAKKDAVAEQRLRRQKLVRNGFIGGFTVMLLFAGIFFIQRNRISTEKERSESLLLNILPEEVADELKIKGHADAKLIDHVSVLFTDFKGFTAMSELLSPKNLVKDLHLCFSEFDKICEKYGIEKIKTIGDAYMAAGGLPTPNKTHPKDVVKAALEIAEVVEKGKAAKIAAGLPYFEIRVGIHTGPVVAGIVGIKKFSYDIWGDTVNTASRMESSGEVGKVNISHFTYELIKEDLDFEFENRGKIKAKGKGEIEMWFVKQKIKAHS